MHLRCPDCTHTLPRRAMLLRATLRCEHCGATLAFGSFTQWLAAALIALAVGLGLLFLQVSAWPGLSLPATIALSLLALMGAVAWLVRPVKVRSRGAVKDGKLVH